MEPAAGPLPEWPYHLGLPRASGVIRSRPEDFFVEELTRVSPQGEGGHCWLWVEKRGANTDWVAGQLARLAECPRRDVGYAGLKDRHAVTRQWFSVPANDRLRARLENAVIEGVKVLEHHPHPRKLKRGTLDGNRFRLKVRQLQGDVAAMEQRLQQVRLEGAPNYFGPQRFGRGGLNVQKGLQMSGRGTRPGRAHKSLYLSAMRSFLFNQVLAARVRKGCWNNVLDGDLAMLNGSQSIFPCKMPDQDIEDRCKRLDIHPTGPLAGAGGAQVTGPAAVLEQQVLDDYPEMTAILLSYGLKASRRSLRLAPAALEWRFEDGRLELDFELPPGTYATVLLREILLLTDAGTDADQGSKPGRET